jgi:rhodanese-related sulfurtransferase
MVIGFAFGYVLEIAGFGKSTKLAAQFYFKEWTVLKVMFGAIITAMVLIFAATGLGLLDYNLIWVNPTYLWPGIVGGLIMGVGFIVGGFCPGTSLVSAATGKLDGIFFVLGVFAGIFLFGETVGLYDEFWYSSYMGRFTLMDLFNVDAGVLVLIIVVAAVAIFGVAEIAERTLGGMDTRKFGKWRFVAAGVIIVAAVGVLLIGQPTTDDKWNVMTDQQERLEERAMYAHPAEILSLIADPKLSVQLIDVRSETDYNLFHILDAVHIPLEDIPAHSGELLLEANINTLFVVMSNDEAAATEAWRILTAESVPNVYVLEGGVNNWLTTFSDDEFRETYRVAQVPEDTLAYLLPSALGSRYPAANPNPDVFSNIDFEQKVEMQSKGGPSSGGCG